METFFIYEAYYSLGANEVTFLYFFFFFCVFLLYNTAKILMATVRMYTCIAVCFFCRLPIKCKTKHKTWKIGKLL